MKVEQRFLNICSGCPYFTIKTIVDDNALIYANFQRIEPEEHRVTVTCEYYDLCDRSYKKGEKHE